MKAGITFLFIFSIVSLFAVVSSDFSSGLDNWVAEGDCTYLWSATGGNPSGYFKIEDDATGDINKAYAPSKFLGDWSAVTNGDYISADIYLSTALSDYIETGNYLFKISGPGGTAIAIQNPEPVPFSWINYFVNMDADSWSVVTGDWSSILEDVQSFSVTGEFIDGDEMDKIDNVFLSFSPVNTPVKIGTISDFEEATGYDGWSFTNTYWIEKEYSGGNSGNFVNIHGGAGFTVGVAPAKFTGSWELLNNNAAIMVDLKNISGNLDAQDPIYLFRISGSGGEAIYPVPNGFHISATQWTTFSAMIKESDWNIISGDWNSIIANVENVKLALDFYNTDSTIGMDNFRLDNSTPQALFVANKTQIMTGEEISFSDFSTNSPDSWFWDFGDNTTSILKNPNHLYQQPGVYSVSLTATNIFGSDTLSRVDYITVVSGVPDSLVISLSDNAVTLRWNKVSEADFYNVYSSDNFNDNFSLECTTQDTTWVTDINSVRKFYRVTSGK